MGLRYKGPRGPRRSHSSTFLHDRGRIAGAVRFPDSRAVVIFPTPGEGDRSARWKRQFEVPTDHDQFSFAKSSSIAQIELSMSGWLDPATLEVTCGSTASPPLEDYVPCSVDFTY